MAESFYINLSLRELSAFKRVSSCAEAAYMHFKRNIDFATGKSNKTYSPYRIGRILSKPALGRGHPAETVSTKKVKGAIEQLCQVGLLCFDFETFKFELPLHDKTPENTPKNTDSGNQSRNHSGHHSRNHSGHQSKMQKTQHSCGFPDDQNFSGHQSGHQSGTHSGHHSGHTDTPEDTPTNKPTITPNNKLSFYGDVPSPEHPERKKTTSQTENLGGMPPIPPESVATLPRTPPAPRKRGETQTEEGLQGDSQQGLIHRLKRLGFAYADNPKSQPYYMNWERLMGAGKLDAQTFERVLAELLQTTQGAPTPRALDEAIKAALVGAAPQYRKAPGRGEMVL